MTMFHMQHPASQTFLTWDELGCLCRALGFPADLFQAHFPGEIYDIRYDERGLAVKTIMRIFEMNLMYQALHRTFNMHTADWNICVTTRAIYMLGHRVLDFEGVHNVRVAYMTYEHHDTKGMLIDRHILLRTLKMCGRTIAPLKLMHRIKHMKAEFEEKGRIQLYEFFNLILWCDLYTAYKPEDMENASGKEDDLFQLVDFHRLLSHHDQRMSDQLNSQYLKDEWDFGMECLGPKEMFKEPPVYTEARIQQAQYHKQNYRHLKNEVNQSQRRVYRSNAGSIRSRPISAPDLDKYRRKKKDKGPIDTSAQAAYESVQRRLHSAPSRANTSIIDRPTTSECTRVLTPRVVTSDDLEDVKIKMENLEFDINTLDSRLQLQVENEMGFYIPSYLEKRGNKVPAADPLPEPEKKPRHWTTKIVNNLVYPPSNLLPSHAKNCDARYRGWLKANTRPGYHVVVTSHTHENSNKGRMRAQMERRTMAPVEYLDPDYVLRYTSKDKVITPRSRVPKKNNQPTPKRPPPVIRFKSLEKKMEEEDRENISKKTDTESGKNTDKTSSKRDLEFLHNKYLSGQQLNESMSFSSQAPLDTSKPHATEQNVQSFPKGLSAKATSEQHRKDVKLPEGFAPRPSDETRHDVHPEVHMRGPVDIDLPEDVPVPHMEHSGPKRVGVGQIGIISLLESIEESRDLEEKLEEIPIRDQVNDDVFEDDDLKAIDDGEGEDEVEGDNDEILNGPKHRQVKSQPSGEQKSLMAEQKKRHSQSAPSPRSRSGTASRKTALKKVSPRKNSPRSRKTPPAKKVKQVKPSRAAPVRHVSEATTKTEDDEENGSDDDNADNNISEEDSSTKNESSSPYYSPPSCTDANLFSPDAGIKFKAFRRSVTSEEENEKNGAENLSPGTEDASSYSDVMTLPSSMGLADLPDSPSMKKSILTDLGESVDSRRFDSFRQGPRLQFELADDLDKSFGSSVVSPNPRDALYTSNSDRQDTIQVCSDYREYLSDSEIRKKTFPKETRLRLVGRLEGAISPNLRVRLMAGDPAISVPAN